ncbi:hypothetical protein [Paraburkholderia sediminicola]|uniref:hypothetical protein n=1 Tax=Paraburkholderia sediminicola TaxID=458836 RepID=UPI0038B71139
MASVTEEQIEAACSAYMVNGTLREVMRAVVAAAMKAAPAAADEPIPMLLFCPRCGTQHIDKPEWETVCDSSIGLQTKDVCRWHNPPHRSHLCHACDLIWRPADVTTTGVESILSKGNADTWTPEMPWTGHNRSVASLALTDQQKADRDLLLYGESFMLDGKHIPVERVTVRRTRKGPDFSGNPKGNA